jgi:hypothetical protein
MFNIVNITTMDHFYPDEIARVYYLHRLIIGKLHFASPFLSWSFTNNL